MTRHRITLRLLMLVTLAGLSADARAMPDAAERWAADSLHVLRWEQAGSGKGTVAIAYSADDGKTWTDVEKAAPDTGSYRWRVPAVVTDSARLRLTPAQGAGPITSPRFAIIPSQEVPSYRWVNVTSRAAFAPRDGAGALTFQGKMWLLGGWSPRDLKFFPRICNNEVWNSADGKDWTLIRPNTFLDTTFDPTADWEGRHTAGYAVFRDKMWIIGGDVNQGHYQSDVWNSADGKTWTLVNPDRPVPWAPRALHYTVVFRDAIWVFGGQTMPGFFPSAEVFYRDAWKTTDGETWAEVKLEEPCWSPRGMIGGAAVLNDRVWILGGGTYDTPTTPARKFFNDVWSSADGSKWTRHTAEAPWAARQYHEVAAHDGRLWVLEGYSGANRNDAWYSADGLNWYEVPNTPWKPRHAASVFVFDGALWMVAGNNMESDVWKLVRDDR